MGDPSRSASKRRRAALAAVSALVVVGAGSAAVATAPAPAPPPPVVQDTAPPTITYTPDGRAHMRLDVMTYNIEGLHWPARSGRSAELSQIGERLAELRRRGEAPDVILFQEMFSRSAHQAVRSAGYPVEVTGPGRHMRRSLPADGHVPGRDWREGELGVRMVGSGLAIVSRYPVSAHWGQPFSHRSCAGLDCLSNKGALFARIAIPGMPDPVEIFDSHMNSRHASRAALPRTLLAHHVEAHELADFIGRARGPENPVILGGDFNMRHSEARFDAFEPLQQMTLVHRYCLDRMGGCEVRMAWTGNEPWMSTEDLQFFKPGSRVDVRPVRVESMFDGKGGGPVLSDHSAFRVVYDLSWPAQAPTQVARSEQRETGGAAAALPASWSGQLRPTARAG